VLLRGAGTCKKGPDSPYTHNQSILKAAWVEVCDKPYRQSKVADVARAHIRAIDPEPPPVAPALFLSSHVFPQEPGGHEIDVDKIKALLRKGDTIAVGNGTIAQAPVELDHESEYKELFSVPKSNMERYLESTGQMIDADLRADARASAGLFAL